MDIFPYDAVVFDLDGTLFDAEEGIVSSVRRAMDEMGLEVPADADLREVVGPPLADSLRDLLGSARDARSGGRGPLPPRFQRAGHVPLQRVPQHPQHPAHAA